MDSSVWCAEIFIILNQWKMAERYRHKSVHLTFWYTTIHLKYDKPKIFISIDICIFCISILIKRSRIIYMYINTYILYGTILMAGAAYMYIYIIQYMYLRLHERAEEGESDLNADEEWNVGRLNLCAWNRVCQ